MKTIGLAELKAKLSENLDQVKAGKELVVTQRGEPVARIAPFPKAEVSPRLQELSRRGTIRLPQKMTSTPSVPLPKPHTLKKQRGETFLEQLLRQET